MGIWLVSISCSINDIALLVSLSNLLQLFSQENVLLLGVQPYNALRFTFINITVICAKQQVTNYIVQNKKTTDQLLLLVDLF